MVRSNYQMEIQKVSSGITIKIALIFLSMSLQLERLLNFDMKQMGRKNMFAIRLFNLSFTCLNVPTMTPAALISTPAALNDPNVSWMFTNGTPYRNFTPPKPPVIPSVIRIPSIGVQP